MRKNKLKTLIFIVALCIASTPLNVFATSKDTQDFFASTKSQSNPGESETSITQQVPVNENTILDGKIGEWDEESIEKFGEFQNKGGEVDGKLPQEGEYVTISVTVPLEMEFWVLPNSTTAFGSFYSPEYTIKNNGSKNIVASIKTFEMSNNGENETSTPLYIETVVPGDGKTQMELKLLALEGISSLNISKEVDLTRLKELQPNEKELFQLSANEAKKVKFGSKKWEIPKYESNKNEAISNFKAGFEFSIKK